MPKQRQNREVARSIPLLLTIPIHALIIVLMVCGCVTRVQAAIPASERQALINFYTSTNGLLWTYKTNWLSSSNVFADPGTECTWYGVGCDASNSTVIGISIENNNISGSLPDLSSLTNLQYIDLDQNHISGAIPSLISFSELQDFEAYNNKFSGQIPSLTGLINLQKVDLRNNALSGPIPALTGLAALQAFNVENNQLTGPIPELAGLTNLVFLGVDVNKLTGTIPSLDGLANLGAIYVSDNQLEGNLPSLAEFPNLAQVDFRNNKFTGTLPALTGLSQLAFFFASNNQLTGDIPSLSGLTNLQNFELSNNQLTGSIPSITGLINLRTLYVDNNQLTGDLPVISTPVTFSAKLCPNSFTPTANSAWDTAVGLSPWYANCVPNVSTYVVSPSMIGDSLSGTYSPTGPRTVTTGQTETFTISPSDGFMAAIGGTCGPTYVTSMFAQNNYTTNPVTHDCSVVITFTPTTTLMLTSTASFALVGAPLTLTATVSGNAPTGAVTFSLNSASGNSLCNNAPLTTVGNSAVATCTTSTLPVGFNSLTAIYAGDTKNLSASGTLYQNVVTSLPTSTVLSSSVKEPIEGEVISLVASISPATNISGTVRFVEGNIIYCDSVPLTSINNILSATCNTAALTEGYHSIAAFYSGDLTHDSSFGTLDLSIEAAKGGFVSLEPIRLLDTRSGGVTVDNRFSGPSALESGQTLKLSVLGRASIPTTGVATIVLNVTATNPTADGYLTAWPAGQPLPLSSNLNFVPNETVPNLVVVPVGANGDVSFYNSAGTTDVVADAVGYFTTGSELNSVLPQRVLDTRAIGHTIDGQFTDVGALTPGDILNLTLNGRGGIPNSGAGVAILNVTATNTTKAGYITAFAAGTPQPLASNLNFAANQTIANLVVAPIGSNGQVSFYNSAGSTDLIADLIGWMPTVSQLNPVTPARLMDTRSGAATIDSQFSGNGALSAGGSISLLVQGRAGIPLTGVDSVILNVTATNPTKAGYITVWPTGTPLPTASNLNFVAGQTVPNLVFAKLAADGTVSLYNSAGTTDLVVDVVGWFSTSP